MRNRRSVIGISLLLCLALSASLAAGAQPADSQAAALVVVLSRYFNGEQGGNGFVIGDGTLVVTNDHIVYQNSEKGECRLEGFVAVYSPYLGRVCDARILATDEKLDLAVLEVPWKGHPALSVADANTIKTAKRACVIGMPALVRYMESRTPRGIEPNILTVDEEELSVAPARAGEEVPSAVYLEGIGKLGSGWSGSPILISDTSEAIGCFGWIRRVPGLANTVLQWAGGPATCHVPRLLGPDFDQDRLKPAATCLPRPDDADEAFRLSLCVSRLLQSGQHESALEPGRAYVQMRPESSYAHMMLGIGSNKLGRVDTARQSYQRAVELDPNSLLAQLLYARFLGKHGEPNRAEEILESLWECGRAPDLVATTMVAFLREQDQFDRCLDILDEAVKARPRNANLWFEITYCRTDAGEPQPIIESLTRAVELYPEYGPWRGCLARVLERTGDLDKAEMHFRTLLENEPESPIVHFWLAQFLHKHRPDATEEALDTAQRALGLSPAKTLASEIEALIAEIRRGTPSDARHSPRED